MAAHCGDRSSRIGLPADSRRHFFVSIVHNERKRCVCLTPLLCKFKQRVYGRLVLGQCVTILIKNQSIRPHCGHLRTIPPAAAVSLRWGPVAVSNGVNRHAHITGRVAQFRASFIGPAASRLSRSLDCARSAVRHAWIDIWRSAKPARTCRSTFVTAGIC